MQQKSRPFELADVQMRARELASGVYAVMAADVDETDHAATNAGFVVGDSSVLVVESLSNGRLASQVIGLRPKGAHMDVLTLGPADPWTCSSSAQDAN